MGKPFRYRGKWYIRFTDETGHRRKKSFDKFTDAAFALTHVKNQIQEVKRGLRSPTPPAKLFEELADYWIANRAKLKRSGKHDESILNCHLKPAFAGLLLSKIGVAETDRYMCDRLHLNRKTVANHITLLISMLRLAVDLGWLVKVPKIRKPRVRIFDKDYSYLRTETEVRRFLAAARDEGELAFTLYATAICTGMREGELAGLRWDKVDFARRLIIVDFSYDGPTKAEDVRYVPILDPLLPVLKAWRLRCPGVFVFPNRDGGMQQRSGRIFQEVLHRVLDAAKFPKTEKNGKTRRYIVFHDLRHTFASFWVMNGGDLYKLQKILGHKSTKMTERYSHLSPAAFTSEHGRLGGELLVPSAEVATLRGT